MDIQFKSYYVVWKLFKDDETEMKASSLNRTMQYGNDVPQGQLKRQTDGLNRTMQYGNYFFSLVASKNT